MSKLVEESPEPSQHEEKVTQRFHKIAYAEDYASDWSLALQHRSKQLFTFVDAYVRNRQPSRWAKCCRCFEGRVAKGCLGHPESEMVSISRLIRENSIKTAEDLEDFFRRDMPRDKDGQLLLPQANMCHPIIIKLEEESSPDNQSSKSAVKKEEADGTIQALKDEVELLTSKNVELVDELKQMRSEVTVALTYPGTQGLDEDPYGQV